ncbi:DDE-type integrase/transposase/recombinase [Streptomyces sp. P3]|uniref:DDE-type integrase/transposase/recombinase n=1 Tax=Streptomyces sp. P3 TaxID=2135430 RepID=UPI0020B136B1|nr:DDE-type integrase/transposase/recombinase [Streptomyces sp. P3]
MREDSLKGVISGQQRRTNRSRASRPAPAGPGQPALRRGRPNQLWVADLTYIRTWSGWVHVAFVLDVYSRMIVGWQLAIHMRTDLPLDALEMALWRRGIKNGSGLIHHSDRGSQGEFNWSSQHPDLGRGRRSLGRLRRGLV